MNIEWTDNAETDLGEIFIYIARDIPIYAEQFVDQIIDAVSLLEEQPLLGREVPETNRHDVRELIFQNYRIIYLIKENLVRILAVIHSSRDMNRSENKPWEIQ